MKLHLPVLALLAQLGMAAGLAAQAPTGMRYNSWKRDQPAHLGTISPDVYIRMDTVSNWVLVPGTPAEVFRRAQTVYGTLKLKLTLTDSTNGVLGNPGLTHTGAFAGERMSYWIRCGEGMTGPNADKWRISMALLSSVEPASKDTTRLRTVLLASARNMAEGSRYPMNCTTTGQMEARIHRKVQELSGVPSGSE